jgi:hypothetical protein
VGADAIDISSPTSPWPLVIGNVGRCARMVEAALVELDLTLDDPVVHAVMPPRS